jgi:hypothetical protein
MYFTNWKCYPVQEDRFVLKYSVYLNPGELLLF